MNTTVIFQNPSNVTFAQAKFLSIVEAGLVSMVLSGGDWLIETTTLTGERVAKAAKKAPGRITTFSIAGMDLFKRDPKYRESILVNDRLILFLFLPAEKKLLRLRDFARRNGKEFLAMRTWEQGGDPMAVK